MELGPAGRRELGPPSVHVHVHEAASARSQHGGAAVAFRAPHHVPLLGMQRDPEGTEDKNIEETNGERQERYRSGGRDGNG